MKLKKGDRVELHAATDHWMRGDRYGEVVGKARSRLYVNKGNYESVRPYLVKLDKSGKVVRVHPENLSLVEVQS